MLMWLRNIFKSRKKIAQEKAGATALKEDNLSTVINENIDSGNTKNYDNNQGEKAINNDSADSTGINYLKKEPLNSVCRTIAIANQKGGVGKSTTAVNMSSYLGDMGYKTLLIDFDPQSNSTSGLGIDNQQINKSIYEVVIINENPKNAILQTSHKNLFIMPSSIQLAGAEVELVATLKREYKLKNAIDQIKKDFDFIIIDCPPALGLLTINALTAADEVLIPIQCEYYALEGLGQLINTINLIKENLNENLIVTGVVMTMFDGRTRLSEQVIDEVKSHFPERVYETIIPRNVRLSEAPSYGKPIIEYDPECKGAQAYKKLTEEVIENVPK